jgi:hypothetical protein
MVLTFLKYIVDEGIRLFIQNLSLRSPCFFLSGCVTYCYVPVHRLSRGGGLDVLDYIHSDYV